MDDGRRLGVKMGHCGAGLVEDTQDVARSESNRVHNVLHLTSWRQREDRKEGVREGGRDGGGGGGKGHERGRGNAK